MRLLPLILVVCTLGCSGLPEAPVPDISSHGEERRAQALAAFEQRRSLVQYEVAKQRWQEGSLASCRTQLEEILERSPDMREARRLLADVYEAEENLPAAEEQLTMLVADDPADAAAHHALGVLLEVTGRTSEAQVHFEQAVRLEPANALYMLSAGR